MGDKPKIHFQYPVYPTLTFLPKDKRAYACWYYYTLAQQLYEKLGKGIDDQFGILEEFPWQNPHYERIARSVAQMYMLESPAEFLKFWPEVEQQALYMDYPRPAEVYKHPLKVIIN